MFPRGRRALSHILSAIALIAVLLSAAVATAQDDGRDELEDGLALLGIFIGTEEKDAVDVMVEGGKFSLPADVTFSAINTRMRKDGERTYLDTPIGSLEIEPGFLREIEGVEFVSEDFLLETLSVPVRFDVEYYAVVLEPPWNADDPLKSGGGDVPEIEPDVMPPIIGMTSLHGDLFTTYSDASDEIGVSSRLVVNGHAFGGVWRLGYSGTDESYEVTDYAWLREVTDNIWALVGRQQAGIHPLVNVVDMTGAQVAYSNQEDTFEQIEDVNGVLLNRGNGAGRFYTGEGPPGGRVELVIDDVVVAEKLIGVDGTYELESPLFGQRRNDVEIRVFEALSNNQVDTVRTIVTANNFLAPKGSFNVVAGAGVQGGIFDSSDESRGATGFARARYAPLEGLTVEAGATYDAESGIEGVVGAAVGLGKFGTAYAAASLADDGSTSVEGLYFGEYGKASLNARVNYRTNEDPESIANGEPDVVENHYAELAYTYSNRLRFGAVARRNVDTTYVLPFASWRVRDGLSFSARPNREGEYRIEARAEPFKNINLQVFYEGAGFARVSYDFETETTGLSEVSLEGRYDEDDGGLGVAVGLRGDRLFGKLLNWQVRGERTETATTASVGVRRELRPGISIFADGGLRKFDEGEQELFGSLGLSVDLGLANGTFSAAPRQATNPRLGRLAGQIAIPEGFELYEEDLKGAKVIVNGKPLGTVEGNGSYWLSAVPKGIHSVRLEADNLPIDLVVDSEAIYAKVAPGAVTPVDFALAVEVGTAGRIIGPDGEPVARVPLEMVNSDGDVVSTARSNQFGLFRMDGLRPGSYTLRALGIWEGESRAVEIGAEYLFGTDLKVSKSSKPETEQKTVTEL